MLTSKFIRIDFIILYLEKDIERNNESTRLVFERNNKHQKLNIKYNYMDSDGSFGIGCRYDGEKGYKELYDSIENEFKLVYDNLLPNFYDWSRSQDINIWEFLFLERIEFAEDKREFLSILQNNTNQKVDLIRLRAKHIIDQLKTTYNLKGIKQELDENIKTLNYSKIYCVKFFNIGAFNISAKKTIFDFSVQWKRLLNEELNKRGLN
jgi:hypothetical protein